MPEIQYGRWTEPTVAYHPIAYSYEGAARAVSMSADYIRRQCATGKLGYRKIGKRVTIPHTELMRWYNSHDSGPQG